MTTRPKLAELIAMSGRATQGEWKFSPGERECDEQIASASPGEIWTVDMGDHFGMNDEDAEFISNLVNWFRETYIKEQT
jgi:hypothetical protein